MRNKRNILVGFIIVAFISCLAIKPIHKKYYIGNFTEKKYDFFESFRYRHLTDFYSKLPFDLKFGGIRPFPFDALGKKEYSWLRKPKNLRTGFNAFSQVGLEKFVSRKKYFEKNSYWCCDASWENKSLNEIIIGFINSDTISSGINYYSKFWQRRRMESNLTETYKIFVHIDRFYNNKKQNTTYRKMDSVLIGLLDFNTKLMHADATNYKKYIVDYFEFLRAVGLNYSAYKLIYNNSRLEMERNLKDSLIITLKYDTLSFEKWEALDDNWHGWITGDFYPDPNRNYGP